MVLNIFGRKPVNKDVLEKLKAVIESKLVEAASSYITPLARTSQLHPSHLNFLRDSSRRQLSVSFTLPIFVQDQIHYSIIVRQMFLLMLTAPMKLEVQTPDISIMTPFCHPSCFGFDIRKSSSSKKSSELNEPFTPTLRRSESVTPEYPYTSKTVNPVFFGCRRKKGQSIDGRVIEWNQNDFTFLYEDRGVSATEARAGQSNFAARNRSESAAVPNIDKRQKTAVKNLKNRIGQGVALVDFCVLPENFEPLFARWGLHTGAKDSVKFDMHALDVATDHFSIFSDVKKTQISSSSSKDSLVNLIGETVEREKANRKVLKLRIFPTVAMNVGSLCDFCISMLREAVKMYTIERAISLHNDFSVKSDSPRHDMQKSCANDLETSDNLSTLLSRINKVLFVSDPNVAKDPFSLSDHSFFPVKLSLNAAMSIRDDILQSFLQKFEFMSSFMINAACIDHKLFHDLEHQMWYNFYENSEKTTYALDNIKNVTLFSDAFQQDFLSPIVADVPVDIHILQDDVGSPIMNFLGQNFQKKHFLLELVVGSSGLHLFQYNISSNIVNSLKTIISDRLTLHNATVIKKSIHLLSTLCMLDGGGAKIETQHSLESETKYSKEFYIKKQIIQSLLWPERRISKLYVLPRDTESKLSAANLSTMVPIKCWRRGVLKSSTRLPLISTGISTNSVSFFENAFKLLHLRMFQESELLLYTEDKCGVIVQPIPLSSSVKTYELREIQGNYIEISERLVDILDILCVELLDDNERVALQRLIQNQCLLRSLNRFSHDNQEAVLGPQSFFTQIVNFPTTQQISSQLRVLPLNMLFEDLLLNNKQRQACDVIEFSDRFKETLV